MSKFRINKRMSDLGICSRREADRLISAGRVLVNELPVKDLGLKVSESDIISVDGFDYKKIPSRKIWLFNKPAGVVTTHKDEKGRRTVRDLISYIDKHVKIIGRLDLNSEGLLIITNDSELKKEYENPKNNITRKYKVRVFGNMNQKKIDSLKKGVVIEGIKYKKCDIEIIKKTPTNSWLEITLYEGKNREIRKMMSHIGLEVSRLIRVEYGKYHLGNLEPGELTEVKQ